MKFRIHRLDIVVDRSDITQLSLGARLKKEPRD